MELEELAEPDWLPEHLTDNWLDGPSTSDFAQGRAAEWASDYPIWLDDDPAWVDAYEL